MNNIIEKFEAFDSSYYRFLDTKPTYEKLAVFEKQDPNTIVYADHAVQVRFLNFTAAWQAATEQSQKEKAKKDGWISVDTALPELRDDSVLAHFANGSIETIHIEDYFRQITDGFDSNGNQKYTRWYLHSTPLVTHWQPLPEPPKE